MFSNFSAFRLEQVYYKFDHQHGLITDTRYFSRMYETRRRVLLAFSQLCRFARQKFLPWVWEHVQSLCVRLPGLGQQECRWMAREMFQGQSRTLIARPSLAIHVRYIPPHLMVSLVPAQTSLKNIIRAYVQFECSDTSEAPPSPAQSRNPRDACRGLQRVRLRDLLRTCEATMDPQAARGCAHPLRHEVLR